MYDHTFYKQVQISRSDIRPHIKWAVSLVILHMITSIFLQALCGYIWVNILTFSPRGDFDRNNNKGPSTYTFAWPCILIAVISIEETMKYSVCDTFYRLVFCSVGMSIWYRTWYMDNWTLIRHILKPYFVIFKSLCIITMHCDMYLINDKIFNFHVYFMTACTNILLLSCTFRTVNFF